MSEVFDDEQYKKDTYSLYTADWSMVTSFSLTFPIENQELDLTKEQRAEFFRIYLEEFSKLKYDAAKHMIPCGQFTVEHQSKRDFYAGVVDYYDIYPTFKKTIAYIRDELKIDMKTSMEDFDIQKISISEYKEDTDEEEEYVVHDQKVIESVKDSLCYGEDFWASKVINSDMEEDCILAEIRTENGNQEVLLYTTSETIQKLKNSADKE